MKDHHRTPWVRPNSLLIRREGSDSGEEQWTEEGENRALAIAGFESTYDEDDLWKKDGVWFGRNAALQHGQREAKADGPYINSSWTECYENASVAEAIAWSKNGNHVTIYTMSITAQEADAKLMGALSERNLAPETSIKTGGRNESQSP